MCPRDENVTCHVSAAIIVTGGLRDGDYVTEVELLRGDGSAWCRLPAAPPTSGHTQSGLELCGGSSCFSSCCYRLQAGAWLTSHTLNHARHDHSAWLSPGRAAAAGRPQHGHHGAAVRLLAGVHRQLATQTRHGVGARA